MNENRGLDRQVAEKVFSLFETKHPEHEWLRDSSGDVDPFGYEAGDYHNGPRCSRCGFGYCEHCEALEELEEPCITDTPLPYSQSITMAWQVVEKMRELGFGSFHDQDDAEGGGFEWGFHNGHKIFEASSTSAPLAICKAALEALKENNDGSR